MKRSLLIILVMCYAILSSTMSVYSDVKVEEEPANPDDSKEKDTTKYDLTPKYTKDMTWTEKIKYEYKRTKGSPGDEGYEQMTFNGSSKAKITDLKDKMPKTMNYSDLKGKYIYTRGRNDEEEPRTKSEQEIDESEIKLKLNENAEVADIKDIECELNKTMVDIFSFNPIHGFHLHKNTVKVGEMWKTKDVCYGKSLFHFERLTLKESEGIFKLEKVKDNIATIKWTGTAKYYLAKEDFYMNFKWDSVISFNVSKQRTLKVTSSVTNSSSFEDETMVFAYKLTRELDYGNKKEEKEEVKPKEDE